MSGTSMSAIQTLYLDDMSGSVFSEFRFVVCAERCEIFTLLEEYISQQQRYRDYRSYMDFIVCELYPKYKEVCIKFYKKEGPPLKEVLSVEEKVSMEQTFLLLLDLIEIVKNTNQTISWALLKKITPRIKFHLEGVTTFS